MKQKLEELKIEAERELKAASDEVELQNVKAKFLGRKGVITEILKGMRDVPELAGTNFPLAQVGVLMSRSPNR